MEWVVLEQVDDAGAQLVAFRLADGERRVLYATEQQSPLRASVHPDALRVAVDVQSRGKVRGRPRTRIGLVNLERRGVGWLKQSLDPKWRIARAVFDDTGTRLALEGAYDGVPISDVYVLELTLSGNSVRDQLLAGAGNPARLGCARPIFVDGGKQVIYLRNTRPEGAWELSMIELERPGDSATLLEGRAPSVLALTLTEGADAVPDVPLVYCGAIKQVFWAGLTRGGSRQQLRTARLGVRPHTDLGRSHQRIEEVAVSSGGELVACSADARVWLTDTETGATVPLLDGVLGASHRGLVFDEVAKRLIFCTNDSEGARMRAVDLVTRDVTTLYALGDVTILGVSALAPTAEISARIEAYESVIDEDAVAPDATAIQRVRPSSDEPLAATVEALGEADDATREHDAIDADASGDDTASLSAGESAELGSMDDAGDDTAAIDAIDVGDDDDDDDVQASSPDPTDTGDTMVIDAAAAAAAVAVAPSDEALHAPIVDPTAPAEKDGPGDAMDISSSFSIESSPADALAGWLKQVAELPDPTESLRSFEDAREDTQIREAARLFLGTQRRRAAGAAEPPVPFLMSIIVAGHLHLHESRSDLQAICKRGRARVSNGDLLEADEHFALSALLYTDGHTSRFGWSTVHQDYTNMFERIGEVLENEGDGPAGRMMAAFCEGYGRQLDGVLQVTPEDVVPDFNPAQYRAQSLADMAAQATEEAILQREAQAEAERAEAAAEAERVQAAEAQAQAEREAIAAEAARKRAAFEAEEQARVQREAQLAREAKAQAAIEAARQAEAQRKADEEARAYAEARQAAEARAAEDARRAAEAQARAKQEEERIWAERRRAAEAAEAQARAAADAEQQAAAEAAQRAAAAAAAKIEAAERARAEAEAALAAAEAAARLQAQDAMPARAPLVSNPPRQSGSFNPLGSPGNRDQAAHRPSGGFDAAPVQAARADVPDFAANSSSSSFADTSVDMPAIGGSKGLPPIMSIAGLFGAASGVALLVLGLKLGGVFPALGIAWIVSGVALFSDKIWGWAAALCVFALNGLSLVMTGVGTPPAWYPAGVSVIWGVATLGVFAALLHPAIRGRYGPKRRKF